MPPASGIALALLSLTAAPQDVVASGVVRLRDGPPVAGAMVVPWYHASHADGPCDLRKPVDPRRRGLPGPDEVWVFSPVTTREDGHFEVRILSACPTLWLLYEGPGDCGGWRALRVEDGEIPLELPLEPAGRLDLEFVGTYRRLFELELEFRARAPADPIGAVHIVPRLGNGLEGSGFDASPLSESLRLSADGLPTVPIPLEPRARELPDLERLVARYESAPKSLEVHAAFTVELVPGTYEVRARGTNLATPVVVGDVVVRSGETVRDARLTPLRVPEPAVAFDVRAQYAIGKHRFPLAWWLDPAADSAWQGPIVPILGEDGVLRVRFESYVVPRALLVWNHDHRPKLVESPGGDLDVRLEPGSVLSLRLPEGLLEERGLKDIFVEAVRSTDREGPLVLAGGDASAIAGWLGKASAIPAAHDPARIDLHLPLQGRWRIRLGAWDEIRGADLTLGLAADVFEVGPDSAREPVLLELSDVAREILRARRSD